MPLNLFIDTNILLSFYALSNADVQQLKQLIAVVNKKDIILFVSDQLMNEVERNRDNKIKDSFKAFRDDNFKCRAPSFVKAMPTFSDLQKLLTDANKLHAEMIKTVANLVERRELEADKFIKELIDTVSVTKTDRKQFNAAYQRFRLGNPPGKNKVTIGDELNWEFLIENVPSGEDLHLVSADSDFASPSDSNKVNSFLSREYKNKNKGELHYYRDLSDFFKLHVPKIKLANQAKLNILISELAASGSFADTHAIIAKFPEDPEFTDLQIKELSDIKSNNSQVGRIIKDPDVWAFYKPFSSDIDAMGPTVDNSNDDF